MTRFIASAIIIIASLSIHFDKLFLLHFEKNLNLYDAQTATWAFFQGVAFLVPWFVIPLKPFKISFLFPIYIYTVQLIWILSPDVRFDDYYLQSIALGSCCLFMIFTYISARIVATHSARSKQIKETLAITNDLLNHYKTEALKP